jgi:8-hydroxy-5-deazaflavin:NADPH oxidoreductase
MRIGILGSGNVGQALAKGFLAEGHDVLLATRDTESDKAKQLRKDIPQAAVCNFEAAAAGGELAVLCTPWDAAADALKLSAPHHLKYKIVIDTNNAVKPYKKGVVQVVGVASSAGEIVQYWLPHSNVIKCWNTVGAASFYKPQFDMTPTMFLCGDSKKSKEQVSELVRAFGWDPLDCGDITASRQLEGMAAIWIGQAMVTGDSHRAFKLL